MRESITKSAETFRLKIEYILKKIEEHPFVSALVINVLTLALVLIFCEIKYETSDDYIMAAIMSGAYSGTPNPHMMYINILWGYLLLPFYQFFPHISWYLISQLALNFCACTAVTYLLLKRMDGMMGLLFSALFITFFSDDVYIVVQFTKTASMAVMAGSLLFLWALFRENKNRKRKIVAGGLLVFAGTLIRFRVIYIAGGFLLLVLAVEFVRLLKGKQEKKWKKMGQIVLAGVILIGTAFSAKNLNSYLYNKDEEYAFFKEYGFARANIVDKPDYGYWAGEEEYQKLGLSENDYLLARTWNFADPDFYDLEMLQNIKQVVSDYQDSLPISRDEIRWNMRERNYWSYVSLWACIFLVVFTVIFNRKYWWMVFPVGAVGYLYLCYFAIQGRLIYRIEYAVFLSTFLAILYFWEREYCRVLENKQEMQKVCVVFLGILCVLQLPTYRLNRWAEWLYGEEYKYHVEEGFYESWNYDGRRYRYSVYNTDAFAELEKEISENTENFYFVNFSTGIQTLYFPYSPFGDAVSELHENSSYLCGVTVEFPDVKQRLAAHGVENPIQSLVEDNVYLIDNMYQEAILTYLQEHYYPDARMELYDTIDGFQIWKFYRE